MPNRNTSPIQGERPYRWKASKSEGSKIICRRIIRIAKTKVGCGEGIVTILVELNRIIASRGRVIDRGHVESEGIGHGIEIDTAALPRCGVCTIILHLESKGAVGITTGVGSRGKNQAREICNLY